jgi:tRNA(Ile)-lysidine synthase
MLRQAGWEWREDASNLDPVFRRNRVRHELLPLLASISRREMDDLAAQYVQNAAILRDENSWLDDLTRDALVAITKKQEATLLSLDGLAFREFPLALQRRLLRAAGREIGGAQLPIGFQAVETVREWILSDKKRKVWSWPGDLRVEWTGSFAGNRIRFWRVSS